jgi:PAS domain S-box-containing protein
MPPARILIVEDERLVAEDIAQLLIGMGYVIAGIVDSGEAAIRIAREVSPDLILMDIHLSGRLTGIEAAAAIRQEQDIPVIYLTAFADTELVEQAKVTLPAGYIVKPFNDREIRSAIEIALHTHSLHVRLRESEERYRVFLENFLGIAYRRDSDFRFEFFHGIVESITGYTAEELLRGSPSWDEIVHPADRETVRDQNATMERAGNTVCRRDYRIVTRSGKIKWVHEILHQVPGKKGGRPSFQGAIYDITERKEAEENLLKLNLELEERVKERTFSLDQQVRFLGQLINTIPSPLYYKDTSCTYLGCNTAFENYLGVPRSRIIGRTDEDIFPADIAAFMRDKDNFLLEHEGIQVYQAKFPHADRTTRDVLVRKATFTDGTGKVSGLIGVLLDITDRIRVEEAMRESEQRFRAVVQDQTDLIWRFLPDGTVIFANPAFLCCFGKTLEDTLGYIFRLPLFPDDQALFERHLASLSEKDPVGTIEVRLLRMANETRWIQWNTRAFFDGQGNVREYLSVGRDITEKRKLEDIQREVCDRLEKTLQENMALCRDVREAVMSIEALSKDSRQSGEISQKCHAILTILDRVSRTGTSYPGDHGAPGR